jgi:hypothetical protein
MFFMMVGWHVWGKQNLSTETYRTTPEKFSAKTQAMVDQYTVRTETDQKIPVPARRCRAEVWFRQTVVVGEVRCGAGHFRVARQGKFLPGQGVWWRRGQGVERFWQRREQGRQQ